MDTKEALELLDQTSGFVGDDEQIEALTANLVSLKEFLTGIDGVVDQLQEDVNRLNEKNRSLLWSNNNLFRQLSAQEESQAEAAKQLSAVEEILNVIE